MRKQSKRYYHLAQFTQILSAGARIPSQHTESKAGTQRPSRVSLNTWSLTTEGPNVVLS